MLFPFLLALGVAVASLTAYAMSWPLVTTHLRDRHPALLSTLAAGPFAPRSFAWLLQRRFRSANDRSLDFLALPACIGAWGIVFGGTTAVATGTLLILGNGV